MSNYRIKRINATLALAYATNATTITATDVELNGLLRGVMVTASDLDSTHTYRITITDQDGYDIYGKASLPESAESTAYVDTNNHPLQLPLNGEHVIKIVTSGSQTANRTFNVTLLVDRG